jgi:hypothetical protein
VKVVMWLSGCLGPSTFIVWHFTFSCSERKVLLLGAGGSAYNPSYSGGRDQEDQGWKPARANSLRDPVSKKIHHKKKLVEWLKV